MGDELDARLVRLLGDRMFDQVATLALEAYGAELHGFLIHAMGNRAEAGDVFSDVAEKFWRQLPRFRRKSRRMGLPRRGRTSRPTPPVLR